MDYLDFADNFKDVKVLHVHIPELKWIYGTPCTWIFLWNSQYLDPAGDRKEPLVVHPSDVPGVVPTLAVKHLLMLLILIYATHIALGADFKNKQTRKQESHQEYYCFLLEQFYLGQ